MSITQTIPRLVYFGHTTELDLTVCLARPISLPRTLNFSRGSSHKIFVKQQKETIELLFSDTNTAAQAIWVKQRETGVESSFLLRQRFTPRQLSKDNRPIVLLLFLMFPHAKDIWRNIHVFQRGREIPQAFYKPRLLTMSC